MSRFLFFTRVFLGLIFIVSGWNKIQYPWIFARALLDYALLPDQAVTLVAVVLPWLELLAGMALVLGTAARGAAGIVALLNLIFLGVLSWAVLRGLDVSCGCFVGDQQARVSWKHILFDVLLGGLALLIARRGPGSWTLGSPHSKESFPTDTP